MVLLPHPSITLIPAIVGARYIVPAIRFQSASELPPPLAFAHWIHHHAKRRKQRRPTTPPNWPPRIRQNHPPALLCIQHCVSPITPQTPPPPLFFIQPRLTPTPRRAKLNPPAFFPPREKGEGKTQIQKKK